MGIYKGLCGFWSIDFQKSTKSINKGHMILSSKNVKICQKSRSKYTYIFTLKEFKKKSKFFMRVFVIFSHHVMLSFFLARKFCKKSALKLPILQFQMDLLEQ